MNIKNLLDKMEKIFLELGFKIKTIGEKQYKYMCYNNCYCKITYLKSLSACVIESANNIEDARNGVLEDSDLYFLDLSEEKILSQLRQDIKKYYMEQRRCQPPSKEGYEEKGYFERS